MCGNVCKSTSNRHTARPHGTGQWATLAHVAAAHAQAVNYTDFQTQEVKRELRHDRAELQRERNHELRLVYFERLFYILVGLVVEITLDQFIVIPHILALVIIAIPEVLRESTERIKRL